MKKLINLVSALAMMVSISACGKSSDGAFKPSLDTNTDCEITVVGHYSNFPALQTEFNNFNEYYPNVRLRYQKLDGYDNTIAAKLENEKPNIFFSSSSMLNNSKMTSVVEHMEDLSDPALKLNLSCIREGLLNRDTPNKLLIVPIFARTYGMLVNDDLFKKEGLTVPTKWADLFSVCESFASKEYVSPMMGYSKGSSSSLMNTIVYPSFVSEIANNKEAIDLANKLDSRAGEYMRGSLTKVMSLINSGCVNLTECNKIGDNYGKVILRFFEGDVPMMICTADTVSGTKSRESQSEAYGKNPFSYSFHPIPLTEEGGYFIDSPSLEFSVNKHCDNLDMTNELMRFLLRPEKLNGMAKEKGLMTPVKDAKFETVYSAFNNVPKSRVISPAYLGIKDALSVQVRIAAFKVGKGQMTIDEAVAKYGSLTE